MESRIISDGLYMGFVDNNKYMEFLQPNPLRVSVSTPTDPSGVEWGLGLGAVQASQVLLR